MTPAGKIQDRIKKRVQESGGQYRKVRWENRRGCPDCFVWWGWPNAGFIEVKAGDDRYSSIQAREVARMQASGIPVLTVRSVEEADEAVIILRRGLAIA